MIVYIDGFIYSAVSIFTKRRTKTTLLVYKYVDRDEGMGCILQKQWNSLNDSYVSMNLFLLIDRRLM